MSAPILYSFRRCPYAMRARMALSISGAQVRLREILLRDKPAAMIEASSKGTVPVLIDGDAVIDESLDVMAWALAHNDPEEWRARNEPALIARNDGDFKHHLDRYKYSTRYENADRATHRKGAMAFIDELAQRLEENAYLCGQARGFADIAIFPFIRQFRIADPDWFDAHAPAALRAWLSSLMDSALFQSVMKKYPLWKDSGEEFLFPNPSPSQEYRSARDQAPSL